MPTRKKFNHNGLLIIQWNCRGIYRKLSELKKYLFELQRKPDVILLQETHLIEKYCPKIDDYCIIRKDKTVRSGGLASLVRRGLSYSVIDLPEPSNVETLCIEVNGTKICNVFCVPDSVVCRADFKFLEHASSKSLILGDFNAHHWAWGAENSNMRGDILYETIDNISLVNLNPYTPTRMNIARNALRRWSLLDLSLASADIASKCYSKVTDVFLGSDHAMVHTYYKNHTHEQPSRAPRWALNKADRASFSLNANF